MPLERSEAPADEDAFSGFEPLDGNFVFCPNQFFDLVIPNCSRPVIRLVGYVLYETLRWLNEDGSPARQDVAISFKTLVEQAGVSRGSIRKAIAEAVEANLIHCVKRGRSKSFGVPGQVAEYSLCWDKTGQYSKSILSFDGFYVGQGNRSPIPHSFFHYLIPKETLAVTKVVATVLRHTVGYQNQYGGGRRNEAHLSYRQIHRHARISSSATVSTAIEQAIESKYIRRIQRGQFASDASQQRSGIYTVNWIENTNNSRIGSKTEVGDRFKNCSRPSVQKLKQDAFKNRSSKGSKSEVGDRFKNRSNIKKQSKTTSKQQQTNVAELEKSVSLLVDAGFESRTASKLATKSTVEQIQAQINWLAYRDPTQNPLGLLRRAIEENWPEPPIASVKRKAAIHSEREKTKQQYAAQNEKRLAEQKKRWIERWFAASEKTREHCRASAIEDEQNPTVQAYLKKKTIEDLPSAGFLLAFKQLKHETKPHPESG